MQNQYITTVTTIVHTGDDADSYRQSVRLSERDTDLSGLASTGYSLAHTMTIPGADRITIVDTLVRPAD